MNRKREGTWLEGGKKGKKGRLEKVTREIKS